MEEKKKPSISEIKEIVLQIGKKEIRLTSEECRHLKTTLEDLFGKEVIKEIHEKHYHHDRWCEGLRWYTSPTVGWPTVYCTSNGDNISYLGGTMSINCNPTSN